MGQFTPSFHSILEKSSNLQQNFLLLQNMFLKIRFVGLKHCVI